MQYGLVVAGTSSGVGKTSFFLGLLAALKARGITVQSCKVGPDFIDPSLHKVITQSPSYNLDAWMGQESGIKAVYNRIYAKAKANNAKMLLVEGAMGLFDGASDIGGPGSAAHIANMLQLPILLVLDVRGMGQSVVAMASGFTRLQKHLNFAGLVCNFVGSANHKAMLKGAFESEFNEGDPPMLGYLPRKGHVELKSRHLGLHMGYEFDLEYISAMGNWVENNFNIDALLNSCANFPPMLPLVAQGATKTHYHLKKQRIAIAYDDAFCFLYPDMPDVLAQMGAECVFFSPLNDAGLPTDCTALYLPGGYPELFADRLAKNTTMLDCIGNFARSGARIYAECGGYMYLMKELDYAGKNYKLCNVLPISAYMGEGKAALGYRQVQLGSITGRGHEFHYAQTAHTSLPPLWNVHDRQGLPLSGSQVRGVKKDNIMASWVHLYPEGSRQLLAKIFSLDAT